MEHSQSGKTTVKTGIRRIQLVEVVLTVLGLLFFGNYASSIYSAKQKNEAIVFPSPTPVSVINTQSAKTPPPSVNQVMQAKKVVQPTTSPVSDYVRCNISAKCGGGYKEMLKSTCDEMVCCTYSLDYPPTFTSRSDCEARAKQYQSSVLTPSWEYQPNYTYPNPDSTRTTSTSDERQKLIDDCKAKAQRTKSDSYNLCPVVNGVQIDSCIQQANTVASQVSAECERIR